jgi:uncharacterized protein YjeT (DUF2065 family)
VTLIVVLVGALIALIGLAVIIAPVALKKVLWALIESDRFYLIAIARIVIGVLFLLAARETGSRLFISIVGVSLILAGLLIPVLGRTRTRAVAEWWMKKSDGILRLWGLMALVLGAALIGAGI